MRAVGKRVSDVAMHSHSELYLKDHPSGPHTFSSTLAHLRTRMFVTKDMQVIHDVSINT